ncbi:MAG TPA: hypothetical protein VMT89_13575, partial [Candidatus Acidoferrales bacterium]|nr:hypothetical protein [Candidatus Acidoferrales bacterium]
MHSRSLRLTRFVFWILVAGSPAILAGCAAFKSSPSGDVLFNGPLEQIAPYHDGDRYVWQIDGGSLPAGTYSQRVSPGPQAGEYVVTMSYSEVEVSRATFRIGDSTVSKLRDDAPSIHAAFIYEAPVPFISVPLRRTAQRFTTGMRVEGMSGAGSVAQGSLEEVSWAFPVAAEQNQFEIHRARTIRVGGKDTYSER